MRMNKNIISKIIGIRIICAILVFFLFYSNLNSQNDLPVVFEKVSKSIVKVKNRSTGNSASGFIWNNSNRIVTALHVVDRGTNIQVYYEGAGVSRSAKVEKVFKDADLVLLVVNNPPALPPLKVVTRSPDINEEVFALGFPVNVSSINSISLKSRYGGRTLRDIVPNKVLREIEENGYPSIDFEIGNFEGNLVPGVSGAPIVDKQGNLIAIADGGLENGAIGISWGIPAKNLASLLNSLDNNLPGSSGITQLFGAELDLDLGEHIKYDNVELIKVRTRTFLQIANSADDQLGLMQLSTVLGFDQPNFKYDIYQDFQSGAIVVIPHNSTIERYGDKWLITKNNSRFEMHLQIKKGLSFQEVNYLSQLFEQSITPSSQTYQWQIDQQFSYAFPQSRFDGLVVNRKAAIGMKYDEDYWQWFSDRYLYETLATRNNVMIAYAVINNDNTPETLQNETYCVQGYNLPECPQLFKDRRIWAQMVLAVHLTSFSLN